MIQGEPLEDAARDTAQEGTAVGYGPVMAAPSTDSAKGDEDAAVPGTHGTDGFLSRTMETSDTKEISGNESLHEEVQDLVDTLASEEQAHDDAWIEAEQNDDDTTDPQHHVGEQDASYPHDEMTAEADDEATASSTIAMPAPSTTESDADGAPELSGGFAHGDEDPSLDDDPVEAATEPTASPAEPEENSRSLLGLQAIGVLNEKISSSEERYDSALSKIGHALGVIAERIDGLEGRITDQKITDVAMAAAPSREEMPSHLAMTELPDAEDDSVAPYIARAERELKARKESGSMDIFDRIAQATETEFDGQKSSGSTRIIENPGDGRRVGTKRWQPSKTVKRRMEQLEKAKTGTATGEAALDLSGDGPRSLRADVEEITAAATDTTAKTTSKAAPPVDFYEEDEDDAGLSVLPGARGRRRNRARKSRLDEDFENVFAEDDAPSIQNLRRKLRDRPIEDETAVEEEPKGGMLGGILGKKSARKAAPVVEPEPDDEDDLMAAFDAPEEREEQPHKPARKGKAAAKKKAKVIVEDDDDDDDDWDDEEDEKETRFAGGPLLYILIAGVAAAGFFAYQQFLG